MSNNQHTLRIVDDETNIRNRKGISCQKSSGSAGRWEVVAPVVVRLGETPRNSVSHYAADYPVVYGVCGTIRTRLQKVA